MSSDTDESSACLPAACFLALTMPLDDDDYIIKQHAVVELPEAAGIT